MSVEKTAPRRTRARTAAVGDFVGRRVQQLLQTGDRGSTRATLAHLRRAVARDAGTVPEVWEITLEGAPGEARGDDPTREETAIHTALTLFAVHQQSREEPMHRSGTGLGRAVRQLEARVTSGQSDGPSPVRRRFDALATAQTPAEAAHHLRGLVDQMRAHKVPLDYARLAEDLFDMQHPARAHGVRLRWAREYYRLDTAAVEDPGATEAAATEEEA